MNHLRLSIIWYELLRDSDTDISLRTPQTSCQQSLIKARICVIFNFNFNIENWGAWRIQGWRYVGHGNMASVERLRTVGGSYADDYNGSSLHYFWLMNYGPNWLRELWSSPSRPDWSNSEHKDRGWSLLVCYLIWIWPICLIISIKIFFWSKTITLWWDRDQTRAFQIYNCSAFKIVTKYKAGPGLLRKTEISTLGLLVKARARVGKM